MFYFSNQLFFVVMKCNLGGICRGCHLLNGIELEELFLR